MEYETSTLTLAATIKDQRSDTEVCIGTCDGQGRCEYLSVLLQYSRINEFDRNGIENAKRTLGKIGFLK